MEFRNLMADEIDCRVAMVKEKGLSLLLYKDARCDMNILDETVGSMNWQRKHTRDNANCIVSIFDAEKQMWIEKEDTGTESNTEAEKGLASDSFKRACFNWGIGRELYTAPFIWITKDKCNIFKDEKGKWKCNDDFSVEDITIENKKIIALSIRNEETGNIVYTFGKTAKKVTATKKKEEKKTEKPVEQKTEATKNKERFVYLCNLLGFTKEEKIQICSMYKLTGKSGDEEFKTPVENLEEEFKVRIEELEAKGD